jgi:hypothetical protein
MYTRARVLTTTLLSAAAFTGCADEELTAPLVGQPAEAEAVESGASRITLLTRNICVGADLDEPAAQLDGPVGALWPSDHAVLVAELLLPQGSPVP